ncbi:MAG TPA: hypothetical protein VN578_14415 [Candidatus Binatia bacterium]|nr:hypothetical protein [Candidatus Binatia bacterium]
MPQLWQNTQLPTPDLALDLSLMNSPDLFFSVTKPPQHFAMQINSSWKTTGNGTHIDNVLLNIDGSALGQQYIGNQLSLDQLLSSPFLSDPPTTTCHAAKARPHGFTQDKLDRSDFGYSQLRHGIQQTHRPVQTSSEYWGYLCHRTISFDDNCEYVTLPLV